MTDDIEQVVRRALRADAALITRESLQYTGLSTRQGTPRVRVLATASVAALAIIGGTVVTAQTLGGRAGRSGPTSVAGVSTVADPLDGTRWKLTAVEHDGHVTQTPADISVAIEFSGGRVSMNDTVNSMTASYTRTPTGYTASQAVESLVGRSTRFTASPDVVLVDQAVGALTDTPTSGHVTVGARVDNTSLVLTVDDYVLTYAREGQARPSPAPIGSTGGRGSLYPVIADPFAGSKWKLASIDQGGQHTQVPPNLDATIEFSNGRVSMNDTVNGIGGRYKPTSGGFTISDATITTVGLSGADAVRTLVIEAIDAIGIGRATQANLSEVAATIEPDSMVLTIRGFTLTFTRDGKARINTPGATATATP
jgi:heat shock protein HslJ